MTDFTDDDIRAIKAAVENGLGVVNARRAMRAVAEVERLRDEIHTFVIKWADTGREPDWAALWSLLDPEADR